MGEKHCDIFVLQLEEKEGKQTNQKTPKAFTYFDSDPSEPLGVRGVGSSNLPVPTIKLAISRQLSASTVPIGADGEPRRVLLTGLTNP
jgi:hypothetical protein